MVQVSLVSKKLGKDPEETAPWKTRVSESAHSCREQLSS